MKKHDEEFYKQINYLLKEYRDGHIKSIPDLMQLVQMMYGDYVEFHPNELPETKYDCKSRPISEKNEGESSVSSSECRENIR